MAKNSFMQIRSNKVASIFNPGEKFEGSVSIAINRKTPLRVEELDLFVYGFCSVVATKTGKCLSNNFLQTEHYLNTKISFAQHVSNFRGSLPPGIHEFPFSFLLPAGLPSSFEHPYGSISYKCTAKLTCPNAKNSMEANMKFKIVRQWSIRRFSMIDNQPEPIKIEQLDEPAVTSLQSLIMGVKSKCDRVELELEIDNQKVFPGKTVVLSGKIINSSSEEVESFSVTLSKIFRFSDDVDFCASDGPFESEEICEKNKYGLNLIPGMWQKIPGVELQIPREIPNLSGCSKIQLYFCLTVKIKKVGKFQFPLFLPREILTAH